MMTDECSPLLVSRVPWLISPAFAYFKISITEWNTESRRIYLCLQTKPPYSAAAAHKVRSRGDHNLCFSSVQFGARKVWRVGGLSATFRVNNAIPCCLVPLTPALGDSECTELRGPALLFCWGFFCLLSVTKLVVCARIVVETASPFHIASC